MAGRKNAFWKYWFTLIVGTIGLAAGITWLVMNVGAQGLPSVIEAPPAIADPPKIVFGNVQMIGNTIHLEAPKSIIGKPNSVEVSFKNEGKGVLRMQLNRTSCGCVHEVAVNGRRVEAGKDGVEIAAGQPGKITCSWQAKEDTLGTGNLRLSAEFQVNDPQHAFYNGLRLEITSVLAAE